MLTLSVIIALVLDRIFPDLQTYRSDKWLASYCRTIANKLKLDELGPWLMLGIMVIPVIVLIALVNMIFSSTSPNLLTLGFYAVVVYLCLGSRSMDRDIDTYIEAFTQSDQEKAKRVAKLMLGVDVESEHLEQIKQVAGGIFVLANRNFYALFFWMIIGGPVVLVLYRMLERIAAQNFDSDNQSLNDTARQLMAWLEWLPAMISGYAFLICGNFDAGLKRLREQTRFDTNLAATNDSYLRQVGLASIRIDDKLADLQMVEIIKSSRGLMLRSLVLWVGIAALFEYLF